MSLAISLHVAIDHQFILYVCIPVFEEMVCCMINFYAFRGKDKLYIITRKHEHFFEKQKQTLVQFSPRLQGTWNIFLLNGVLSLYLSLSHTLQSQEVQENPKIPMLNNSKKSYSFLFPYTKINFSFSLPLIPTFQWIRSCV